MHKSKSESARVTHPLFDFLKVAGIIFLCQLIHRPKPARSAYYVVGPVRFQNAARAYVS